jgi:hypothetical protein
MGSVKSEVYSQIDVSSILSDEIIYFVPEHYDALAYSILRTKAEVSPMWSANKQVLSVTGTRSPDCRICRRYHHHCQRELSPMG